jgi:hypothetical protein
MPAPGIRLGYRRSSQQTRQHGARSIIERVFHGFGQLFCGSKDFGRRWPDNIRAGVGLPDFSFANDAPGYCSAVTSSPPVRFRPNKFDESTD